MRYSLTDWLLAAVVTAGITIFLISGPHRAPGEAGSLGAESEAKRVAPMRLSRSALSAFFPFILSFVEGTGCSTLAGLALLSGFLALDGLTSVMGGEALQGEDRESHYEKSHWHEGSWKDYETSKWNQILYVNLLSSTTSAAALVLALSSSDPSSIPSHLWLRRSDDDRRSFPVSSCPPSASRGMRCFGFQPSVATRGFRSRSGLWLRDKMGSRLSSPEEQHMAACS